MLKNWPFYPRSKSNRQMFNHVFRNVHHVLLPSPFVSLRSISKLKCQVKLLFSSLNFISSQVKPNLLFGIIYISPLAKVIADLFASYCTPPNRKTCVSPSAIFIGGQMGGTARPSPGTPRPNTPGPVLSGRAWTRPACRG